MATEIDLSSYRVFDAHCHPFQESSKVLSEDQLTFIADLLCGFSNPAFLIPGKVLDKYTRAQGPEKERLDQRYGISGREADRRLHAQNLLLYRVMIRQLSRLLNCLPDPEHILRARNQRSANYREYITQIFDDAKIDGLNVDDGYSELTVRRGIPSVDLDLFRKQVPATVTRTTRVEPILQKSLERSATFEQMESDFVSSLEYAVKTQGAVALKSVIAYRSGLRVHKTRPEDAKKDFRKYKSSRRKLIGTAGQPVRNLRNHLTWIALRESIRLCVPFLFHTGVGDQDILLHDCDPTCLWDMLVDEELRHARVVLVHGGYPYLSEAAFLTTVLPNVYLDLSILVPLAHANPNRIAQVLEMAPLTKIMYASDYNLPETYWLSAKIGKKMLGQALGQMVHAETLTEEEAYEAAGLILTRNAKRLYKLSA